jgi:hypothetical protein
LHILEIIGWFLITIVKFLFTPSAMVGLGYGFLETFAITAAASVVGVTLFYHGGEWFFAWVESKRKYPLRKKKSSARKRRLIKVKRNFGLRGLALIAGLISIPLASLLAAKYFRNRKSTLMIVSFVSWALFLTAVSTLVKNFF